MQKPKTPFKPPHLHPTLNLTLPYAYPNPTVGVASVVLLSAAVGVAWTMLSVSRVRSVVEHGSDATNEAETMQTGLGALVNLIRFDHVI